MFDFADTGSRESEEGASCTGNHTQSLLVSSEGAQRPAVERQEVLLFCL